jgi:hypothetical protein
MTVTTRVLVILAALGAAQSAQAGETVVTIRPTANVSAVGLSSFATPRLDAARSDVVKRHDNDAVHVMADPVVKRAKLMLAKQSPAPAERCADADCDSSVAQRSSQRGSTAFAVRPSSSAA